MSEFIRLIATGVLSGGGVPAISVSPSSWDFGSTPVGTPVSKEFTIENTGTAALEITLPITSPAGFTVTVDPATSVAPGGSTTFTVEADADSVDVFSGNLSIVSNAASSPTLVAITATVTIITSGLVAWYDASDAATLWEDSARTIQAADNADVIGAWDDKSGNAYHVTQGTTANKPTLRTNVQNGKPVIRFDGSDDSLVNTSFPDFSDAYTLFIVGKWASAGSGDATQVMVEVSTGTSNTGFVYFHEAVTRWRGRDATTTQTVSGDDIRNGTVNVIELTNSGTLLEMVRNGVSKGTAAYTSPNPNTLNQLNVGNLASVANYFLNGDLFEIVLYSRHLSSTELTNTRNYLNAKWAVY